MFLGEVRRFESLFVSAACAPRVFILPSEIALERESGGFIRRPGSAVDSRARVRPEATVLHRFELVLRRFWYPLPLMGSTACFWF